MTHQQSAPYAPEAADAGRQVAQLRHVLVLVHQLSRGAASTPSDEAALDENARISSAYEAAPAIVRRRFDALAAETSAWAAIGVEALLVAQDVPELPNAAALRLADELAAALRRLEGLLSVRS